MADPDDEASVPREADRVIFGGLLGLAAAAVIQLGDKADLDLAQTVEVCAFAVAIPFLAAGLVTDFARRAGTVVPGWRDAVGLLGSLAAVVGLAAVFFHYGVLPGALFAAAGVAGFVLVRRL